MTGRRATLFHLVLLAALAAGAGVWLWRAYGFQPLHAVESGQGGAR